MKSLVKSVLPHSVKEMIRTSRAFETYYAGKISKRKRLDLVAAQFAHNLHLAGIDSLREKVCLEIGSGWVLTHAIVCHLLGAKKVYCTDLEAHAMPSCLRRCIRESVPAVVRDLLSPFEEHPRLRERLDRLIAIDHFDFDTLAGLGIEYVAPFDFARASFDHSYDFVYSFSVLEHVPCADLPGFLANIETNLSDGGITMHSIHLEDHIAISADPFRFLEIPAERYGVPEQSYRGNRVRLSGWEKLFGAAYRENQLIYKWSREDKPLPKIDPSIEHVDEADLRVSHIGVLSRK